MSDEDKRASAVERAWEVRRARMRRIVIRFAALVGIPTLLAIAYYGIWAADEFVSVTVVTVQSPPAGQQDLGGSFVANRDDDSRLVVAAIRSRDALEELIAKHKWLDHYATSGNVFSSLDRDAGSEEAHAYYLDRLEVASGKGQALRLSVRAFDPKVASEISAALVEIATVRLNAIALRPLAEQARVAASRVESAEKRLANAPRAATAEEPEPPERVAAREELANAKDLRDKIELARVARTRYMTIVSGPSIPTEASYPRRLWSIATVFVVAFSLMGVFSLLLGAVREHAKV